MTKHQIPMTNQLANYLMTKCYGYVSNLGIDKSSHYLVIGACELVIPTKGRLDG